MFNTSNKDNYTTIIIKLIKYLVTHYSFTLIHSRLQCVTLTPQEKVLYISLVISRGCLHWYRFHQSEFKSTPVVLPRLTMQGLVEDFMYVSQGKILMSTEVVLFISGYLPGS